MKLKPKLAVSAFLIVVLPILLILTMGIVTLYSTLGVSRATRARSTLWEWADLASHHQNFIPMISRQPFYYVKNDENILQESGMPLWLNEFIEALKKEKLFLEKWI